MSETKYAHVTIIYDDGEKSTILDIPQIENFEYHIEYETPEYRAVYVHTDDVIKKLTLSGKPIKTKDGVVYTEIFREKTV